MTALSWGSLATPVGTVSVGCSPAGVARVRYDAPTGVRAHGAPAAADGAGPGARALADAACRELIEYFCGDRRAFDLTIDWSATTGVQRSVLTVLTSSVGYGKTISYGALARAAGLTDESQVRSRGGGPLQSPAGLAARAVGTIMASNPIPVIVPCHRVVASDGLGGYSGGAGIEVKRWLLILEGSLPPTLGWQPMTRPA